MDAQEVCPATPSCARHSEFRAGIVGAAGMTVRGERVR
jgi:hypothetical protein